MGLLFEDVPRTLLGGKDALTTDFDYLNMSARPEAARVREVVEGLLKNYPEPSRPEMIARLQAADEVTFHGAEFELILHELLLRSGALIDLPPGGPKQEKKPDFHVRWGEASGLLEATIATGRSRDEVGANRRIEDIYEAIDSVRSPDFFLGANIDGAPTQPISLNALKRSVEMWIATLNYDVVRSGNDPEPLIYKEHGCEIEVTVFARGNTRGKDNGGALGIRSMEPMWADPSGPLLSAFKRKCSRYGRMKTPYIIAINAMSEFADMDDFVDALFGKRQVQVTTYSDGRVETQPARGQDGAWMGPAGPRNRRVSAVVAARRLGFWSLGQAGVRIFHNPWAEVPFAEWKLEIEACDARSGRPNLIGGRSVREILELPRGWPEV